ncbi:putative E3 ubiquitin-protein ligase XERICO [Sesamum alatum]|uniref:E3 ubiquitin-protein ligase XERICO n=1 Tax=Sesamum alatum TaxID=300844 RepID=A0AAE2CNA6_9LAMI|nr:putative E3 ubiquitin-protein ligase XERICO [Sesamum alatum]
MSAGATKTFLGMQRRVRLFFSTLLPQALRFIILLICLTCKYYRRMSCHYKYMSTIEERSSKFICRRELNQDLWECAICLSEIRVGEEGRELKCQHVFHRGCLDRWLRYCNGPAACPLCRRAVLAAEVVADYKRVRNEEGNYELEKELALILLSTLHHRSCNEF